MLRLIEDMIEHNVAKSKLFYHQKYNDGMGEVDFVNQMVGSYHLPICKNKWW